MSLNNVEDIAKYIVSNGKGILAADESNPTCGKRFDSINVENNELNRRNYREMLFKSEGMEGNIGGVILFDETLRQSSDDGRLLKEIITEAGALPGIKVDKGLQPFKEGSEEVLTQGLDGLNERCKEYDELGAKFTKWRAVIKIGDDMPSQECIDANMSALAKYAKIAQDNNMVPIVEPEVLMDGDHDIDACFEASSKCLTSLFNHLNKEGVNIKGTLLKPNMITHGFDCPNPSSTQEIAEKTVKCLSENISPYLPGVTFLSGGQTDIEATERLDAMNKLGGFPWKLSFSYGRALQQSALKAWKGNPENSILAQEALSKRAHMNRLASEGRWSSELE